MTVIAMTRAIGSFGMDVAAGFAADTALVLAHIEIDEKSNEIPSVQKPLEELDVAGHIVTLDAMHCQKHSKPPPMRRRI